MRTTAAADPLAHAFLEHARAARLLPAGGRVLVALSGGLDSVVLLHLLRFHGQARFTVAAAHFDHRMRPGSAADADWVRGLCRAWQVPLVEGGAAGALQGEAAARTARYGFLERAAAAAGAAAVATAHHLDDQAETLLLRIARGAGLRGLVGIRPVRGLLVRPLLPFRRRELLAYARRARVRWREDPTNRSDAFVRNRVRRTLLPRLEAAWPEAVSRLGELAAAAAEVEGLWRELLPGLAGAAAEGNPERGFQLARGVLREYHPQTRARVLRYLLQELGAVPGRRGTRAAVEFISSGASGTGISFQGGIRLEREFDHILLRRPAAPGTGSADRPIRILGAGEGAVTGRIAGRSVRALWGSDVAPADVRFDPAALRFPLVLRGWQPGDRILLPYGTKKVKKLLQERRVGRSARARVLVLAEQDGGGRVLWVENVARTAMVPERGTQSWQIRVEHGKSG